jgi:hypothetical protein
MKKSFIVKFEHFYTYIKFKLSFQTLGIKLVLT